MCENFRELYKHLGLYSCSFLKFTNIQMDYLAAGWLPPSPIYKPRDVETFTFAPVNYLGAFFILFYLKYGLTQCVIFGLEVLPPFSGAVNSADKL